MSEKKKEGGSRLHISIVLTFICAGRSCSATGCGSFVPAPFIESTGRPCARIRFEIAIQGVNASWCHMMEETFPKKKTGNFRHTEVQQRFVFLVARFKRSPKCCVVTPSFTQITRQLRNPNIFWAPLPPISRPLSLPVFVGIVVVVLIVVVAVVVVVVVVVLV